jgi:hypothetical protein
MVARNASGACLSATAVSAPRTPASFIWVSRLMREETSENSEPAKKPYAAG